MAKKLNRLTIKAAFLALNVASILSASSPSWAGSYGYHDGQRQGGRCSSWQDCSGSGFIPRHSRRPSDDPYEQGEVYDDRDFDEELPYDPYQRTITLPVPGLPSGTEKIIEGMFDLILNNR